jgi:membrane-associated phospholipid phosphatase
MDLLSPTLPFIENLQKMSALKPAMLFLSFLGSEYFYLLMLPVLYWGVSRRIGVRLGALLLFSVVVNEIFKVGFAQPRPYWLDASLGQGRELSFGLPSGHSQNAFLIWLFLALQTSERKLWVPLALLLALAISFSRIYLGVHFPTDCLAGAAIGLVILGGYRWGGPAWMRFWHQLSPFQKITFGIVSTAFLAAIYAVAMIIGTNDYHVDYGNVALEVVQNARFGTVISPRLGAFLGLICGVALAARYVDFEARTTVGPLAIRFVIGFIGLAVVYLGLREVLPNGIIWSFLRYGLVSFWVIFGAPIVFEKIPMKRGTVASG